MNTLNSIRFSYSFAWLVFVSLALSACGAGDTEQGARDAPDPEEVHSVPQKNDSEPEVPAWDEKFDGECGSTVTGMVDAPAEIAAEHGVVRYDYEADLTQGVVTVNLIDDQGDAAGSLAVEKVKDARGVPTPNRTEIRWTDPSSAEVTIMNFRLRPLDNERAEQVTRVERGGDGYEVVSIFGPDNVEDIEIRRTVPQGEAEPQSGTSFSTLGGNEVHTLDLWENGEGHNNELFDEWAREVRLPDWSDSPAMELMGAVFADLSWIQHTVRHIGTCAGEEQLRELERILVIANIANQNCNWVDVITTGGGLSAAVAVGSVVLIVVGVTVAPVVAVVAAVIGAVAAVAYTVYFIAKKNCTAVRCMTDCAAAGAGGGTCTGALSCTCDGPTRTRAGGDPHIVSLDRIYYDFQGIGEYVLAEAVTGEPFVVQGRLRSFSGGRCPRVSVHQVMATRLGGHRVTLKADPRQAVLTVDGEVVDLIDDYLELGDGATISREPESRRYQLRYSAGEVLTVNNNGSYLNMALSLPSSRFGEIRGVWGTFDGDITNEVTTRDGRVLEEPVDWDDFYRDFGDSWRVTQDESLFNYATGEDTSTFTDSTAPVRPPDPDGSWLNAARQTCRAAGVSDPILVEACALDVGCTQDPSFAEFFNEIAEINGALAKDEPIFLDNWTQEGVPAAGRWTLSPDSRSVNQEINGDPTFFVSDAEYIDTTLRGRLQTTNVDDDYMGFVFGYQGPLAANGDGEDAYDFYVVTWKSRPQFGAPAGLTLARVTGPADSSLFDQIETMTYEILDSDWGPGKGWLPNVEHEFELTYTPQSIEILIDGEPRLATTTAEAGVAAFPSGRFGFFNNSQSDVTYSSFRATTEPAPSQELRVRPSRTYLRTQGDAASDVVPIDLELRGFEAGDPLVIERTGEYEGSLSRSGLTGIFSSTNELGDSSQLVRLPGAIDAGIDIVTPRTAVDQLATDVPEDFAIASASNPALDTLELNVPPGARYLFVSPFDDRFEDNSDADDDFGFRLSREKAQQTASFMAETVVADSIAEFSGTQGQDGWSYGYIDVTNSGTFQPLTEFDGETWYADSSRFWTQTSAARAHPNGSVTSEGREPVEHHVVRRWTSDVNGTVTVDAVARMESLGSSNGVVARVLVDGLERHREALSSTAIEPQRFRVVASVGIGSTIDLVMEADGDDTGDQTFFSAKISKTSYGKIFLQDSFDQANEGQPQLTFDFFRYWEVETGTVDLVGRGLEVDYPAINGDETLDGLLVDLAGLADGTLVSRESYELSPGNYLLQVDAVGPIIGDGAFRVNVGSRLSELVSVPEMQPFATYAYPFSVTTTETVRVRLISETPATVYGVRIDDPLFMRVSR